MSIVYRHGNLLDCKETLIAHGCNAQGAFGSGVAGAIAKRWPQARDVYIEEHKRIPFKLGDVEFVRLTPKESGRPETTIWIAHCITQERFGSDGKRYASPEAIGVALSVVRNLARRDLMIDRIALPRIGCGLGGLDWEKDQIAEIYENVLHPIIPVVYDIDKIEGTVYTE